MGVGELGGVYAVAALGRAIETACMIFAVGWIPAILLGLALGCEERTPGDAFARGFLVAFGGAAFVGVIVGLGIFLMFPLVLSFLCFFVFGVLLLSLLPGLFTGTVAAVVKARSLPEGHSFSNIPPPPPACSLAFSPGGRYVASGRSDRTIWVQDTSSGQNTRFFEGHAAVVQAIAFSPDGQLLASGDEAGIIKLWNTGNCEQTATLQGHPAGVLSLAFSPDGRTLASGSEDSKVKLWEAASGGHVTTLQGHADRVWCVAFSPDGKTLASGSRDKTIKFWDTTSGASTATVEGHRRGVMSVAFSPDGKTLASGGMDGWVGLWNAASGENVAGLHEHTDLVKCLAFSPDGKILASCSGDTYVKLWDVASGKVMNTLRGHGEFVVAVVFNKDGTILLSGSLQGMTVLQWDVFTARNVPAIPGYSDHFSFPSAGAASEPQDDGVKTEAFSRELPVPGAAAQGTTSQIRETLSPGRQRGRQQ